MIVQAIAIIYYRKHVITRENVMHAFILPITVPTKQQGVT